MEGQNQNSGNKIANRIITCVFLLLVFGLTIAGFFSPVRARSESENRNLAQKPAFSFEALFCPRRRKNGNTVQYEKYLSDQFVGRDAWIGLKTRTERLLGKTDINGVYFCRGTVIWLRKRKPPRYDHVQEEKNIKRLVEFVKKISGKPFNLVYLGTSSYRHLFPLVSQIPRMVIRCSGWDGSVSTFSRSRRT